jgi:hypothetical protein
MKKLRISDDLALPLDVVTQTIAILAKRRVGKSYLMRKIVEQLFRAGQQVVLVDPKGDQWGGHFSNTIGPLSTVGLITRRDGIVRPTNILFPEGLS